MSDWSTSNYRRRKAARQGKIAPTWETNPETGEKFLIRRVSRLAYAVAGALPRGLTATAVEGWKEQGIEAPSDEQLKAAGVDIKELQEHQQNLQLMGRIVIEALVEPKIVDVPENDNEIELRDLDDSDLWFIFHVATGQKGSSAVPLQGGQVASADNLAQFRKKPGRRSRTGTNG